MSFNIKLDYYLHAIASSTYHVNVVCWKGDGLKNINGWGLGIPSAPKERYYRKKKYYISKYFKRGSTLS